MARFEIHLRGLNKLVSTSEVSTFFAERSIRPNGVYLVPGPQDTQEAHVSFPTEAEATSCLGLRSVLEPCGITVSQVIPRSSREPLSGPLTRGFAATPSPSAQPRNLYVLNLPLDLTQEEFKELFLAFGTVEHSTLLSQLDNQGRRRGFILMSSNDEAGAALNAMHGKWVDGFKLDISWALIQREGRASGAPGTGALPNRVVHPPSLSTRRGNAGATAVMLENLDPLLFPDDQAIIRVFSFFGPISAVTSRVTLFGLSSVVTFHHQSSATALVSANWLKLGDRTVKARFAENPIPNIFRTSSFMSPMSSAPIPFSTRLDHQRTGTFDPFADDHMLGKPDEVQLFPWSPNSSFGASRALNVNSRPFLPFTAMNPLAVQIDRGSGITTFNSSPLPQNMRLPSSPLDNGSSPSASAGSDGYLNRGSANGLGSNRDGQWSTTSFELLRENTENLVHNVPPSTHFPQDISP